MSLVNYRPSESPVAQMSVVAGLVASTAQALSLSFQEKSVLLRICQSFGSSVTYDVYRSVDGVVDSEPMVSGVSDAFYLSVVLGQENSILVLSLRAAGYYPILLTVSYLYEKDLLFISQVGAIGEMKYTTFNSTELSQNLDYTIDSFTAVPDLSIDTLPEVIDFLSGFVTTDNLKQYIADQIDVFEIVQGPGSSTTAVMSQNAVTEELRKKASMESVTESISAHNTSTTAHADIRELLNTCVGLPAYDSSSYKITFTTLAGATVEIDLPIEQLALRYNAETDSIEFDNADGTTTSIPVSAFVKEYVGSIGDRIQVSIDENNVIHATILKNSIDWGCLSFELQERINDHVTSADFATKAVRTDIAQTLSAAQQEQAWSNLGLDLVVLKFPEGATSVVLTDEEDAKLAAGAAVLVTVDGTNASSGIYNADNHIFASYNFTRVLEPRYYSLFSHTSALFCTYKKASKTFVYNGSLRLNDTGALRFDRLTSLSGAQQSQAFENLGWKVHVISESAIGSSDAVSDDEKAARLSTTALLVQETGLLYNFSITSGGSRRFYGQFSNSFCTALNVNEATGVITSSFAYLYDPSAVSFDCNQSSVSDDNKNKALGNIGIDLVRIPHSLLGTTLSDEMFAVLDNARGIIVVNTSSNYDNPTVFIKGINSSRACYFVSHNTGTTYCQIQLNKSTKILSNISAGLTYAGSVRYAETQNLTTSQQDTALSNIGLDFVIVDYSELATTLSDDRLSQLVNAKGIILTNTPDDYIHSVVFTAGTKLVSTITFSSIENFQDINYFVLNIPNKTLSLVQTSKLVVSNLNQNLTNTQKDMALSNIGLPLVHVDYSLIGSTLDDSTYNKLLTAKGVFLENVSDGNNAPSLYFVGSSDTVTTIFVSEFNARVWFVLTLSHTSKKLSLVSTGYATDVVRYREGQNLTNTQKNTVLSNIGLDFVQVDYSLLGTILDDSTAAVVENANGIVLTNTPESYSKASVFLKSVYSNNIIYFNAWNGVSLVSQFSYNISTKQFTAVSATDLHFDSVRYNVSQDLTDVQKQQARTNIGVKSADELLEDVDFIAQLKTKLGIA